MPRISKRFVDRAKPALRKYQRLLEQARKRDVNESDTCVIISDFLQDVLGYDKYAEVTTEFAVRSTFCDLAIKSGGRLQYLIEVKSIGTELKENHFKQAVDYAANQGVDWVLLTNGIVWHAHKLRFEKPIHSDEVFTVDLLDQGARPSELLEKLFLVSKEAGGDNAIAEFMQQKEATSRYVVAQLLMSEDILIPLRRELRQLFTGVRIEIAALQALVRDEVIKRDCLEGDRAAGAERLAKRAGRKRKKKVLDLPAAPALTEAALPAKPTMLS